LYFAALDSSAALSLRSDRMRFPWTGLTAVVLFAVPHLAGAQADRVVARLGAFSLTAADVQKLVAAQPPEARAQIGMTPDALDRVVRTELVRRALLAEARKAGWDKQPEVIERIEHAREQVVVSSYMNRIARPPAGYPSDAEVAAYYEANKTSFMLPRRYHLAQIHIKRPPDEAGASRAANRAVQLAEQARAPGADFAALASKASEHAESAARGGDMGWIEESNLAYELRPAMAQLAKSAVSEPIAGATGWHIVKHIDNKPEAPASLELARPAIVNALRMRRAQELERAYIDALLSKGAPTLDVAELDKIRKTLR
jgi:peptidylprolyl isomerase